MIAEVVRRRYKYALQGEELWPDLILIDGGIGHLHAAQAALKEMKAPPVKIAAIAKREEELYLQGSTKPLKLPRHSPVLKLLQYVRDEAHRFAQHYFHILRKKKMLNTEDAADLAAYEERKNEPTVSFEKVIKKLRKNKKI
jgi:excinuclease ABC subunit C